MKPIRKMVDGEWKDDTKRCRQVVSWVDPSGDTWQLTGAVPEAEAIDLGTGRVGRCVVEVAMGEATIAAREKGGNSRDVTTLQIRRILQIWETPEKALYTHPDHKAGK